MIEGPESRFFDDFQTFQNLRNQIMTTNLWVEQFWFDHKLVSVTVYKYFKLMSMKRLKLMTIDEEKNVFKFSLYSTFCFSLFSPC